MVVDAPRIYLTPRASNLAPQKENIFRVPLLSVLESVPDVCWKPYLRLAILTEYLNYSRHDFCKNNDEDSKTTQIRLLDDIIKKSVESSGATVAGGTDGIRQQGKKALAFDKHSASQQFFLPRHIRTFSTTGRKAPVLRYVSTVFCVRVACVSLACRFQKIPERKAQPSPPAS
jgi:hypothetical protein